MVKDEKYYYTRSMNVSAYLELKGFEVRNCKVIDGFTTFYFDRLDEVFDAVREYNKNEELKKFISCFSKIKEIARNK